MENIRKAFKIHGKENNNKGVESEKIVPTSLLSIRTEMRDKRREEKDVVRQGVKFYANYLGSTLVEEIEDGQSYGDKISPKAVKVIHDMAKNGHRKPHNVEISVSVAGIQVMDTVHNILFTDLTIYRIHFCTADRHYDHIFAYIARSTENETMECHAFMCHKRKTAQTMALTVAQAFQIVKEDLDEQEMEREREKLDEDFPPSETEVDQLNSSTNNTIETKTNSLEFEDNFADIKISSRTDPPPVRTTKSTNPFTNSTFNNLSGVGDLNNSLLKWLDSQKAKEGFGVNSKFSTTSDLIKF